LIVLCCLTSCEQYFIYIRAENNFTNINPVGETGGTKWAFGRRDIFIATRKMGGDVCDFLQWATKLSNYS